MLRADLGITLNGSNVSAWADQWSGARNVTQATGANQPPWSATAGPNGLPVVQCDGVSDYLQSGATTIAQPFIMFAVCKNTAQAPAASHDEPLTLGTVPGTHPTVGIDTTPHTVWNCGASITYNGIVADGVFARCEFVGNGASSVIRENDTVRQSGNAGTGNGTRVVVGALAGGTHSATIEIAEWLILGADLSASPLARIRNYQKARYALT